MNAGGWTARAASGCSSSTPTHSSPPTGSMCFRPLSNGNIKPKRTPITESRIPNPDPDDVVGGWFRFALDDPAWQARLIERAVAWRVRLFRLPYGDQGLFVRRHTFAALGGYRDIPLMEDVEFVGRLLDQGRVVELPRSITTSAPRWRRDGWFRRSARNMALLGLYFCGVLAKSVGAVVLAESHLDSCVSQDPRIHRSTSPTASLQSSPARARSTARLAPRLPAARPPRVPG